MGRSDGDSYELIQEYLWLNSLCMRLTPKDTICQGQMLLNV